MSCCMEMIQGIQWPYSSRIHRRPPPLPLLKYKFPRWCPLFSRLLVVSWPLMLNSSPCLLWFSSTHRHFFFAFASLACLLFLYFIPWSYHTLMHLLHWLLIQCLSTYPSLENSKQMNSVLKVKSVFFSFPPRQLKRRFQL